MKTSILKLVISLLMITSCSRETKRELSLKPLSNYPIYSVKVDDAAEVDLLRQELHMTIVKVVMPDVYFIVKEKEILKQLTVLGYTNQVNHNPDQVYSLYGKVEGNPDEQKIKSSGVVVVNREHDHFIVFGTLAQLKALKELGYVLLTLDYELRPREIETSVKSQEEIQNVYNMGVDIFTSVNDKEKGFVIHGSAFDFQIDSLKKLNFSVKIIKPRI